MTIFGEGPERKRLTGLIENLGLEQNARLAGKTLKPGGWIHTGNIFVLSSRFEGFPNALVDAVKLRSIVRDTDSNSPLCPLPVEVLHPAATAVYWKIVAFGAENPSESAICLV